MPHFFIILVEPKNDGNIGAVSRAMKNFGFLDLIIVNHPNLDGEAYKRAMHANDILQSAVHVRTLDKAIKGMDIVVGTSGKTNVSAKNFLRSHLTPREFVEKIQERDCNVGILFGREDFGLVNKELRKCDIIIQIPNDPKYPSMNLSHAVAVVLYEIFMSQFHQKKARKLTRVEKEKMFEFYDRIVECTNFSPVKKEKAKIAFRRCISRALPTEHEFSILMGVFNKTLRNIEKPQK